MHNQHIGRSGPQGDGHQIGDGVIRQLCIHRRTDRERRRIDQNGIAVGLGASHGRTADRRAGPRTIVDNDGLPEALRNSLAHQSRGQVGAAAWRKRHDDTNGFSRILLAALGERCLREYRKQGKHHARKIESL